MLSPRVPRDRLCPLSLRHSALLKVALSLHIRFRQTPPLSPWGIVPTFPADHFPTFPADPLPVGDSHRLLLPVDISGLISGLHLLMKRTVTHFEKVDISVSC